MKQYMNNNSSNTQKILSADSAEGILENSLPPSDMVQINVELQQQSRYLNLALEAYGDCV